METVIKQALLTIETQEQVRILYACESGSRAWGFASDDSDYDVRFIYMHPKAAYLRLDPPRDVIERPIVDDLDINGWDIFKALHLLRKSNPPLLEWFFSPIIYLENSASIEELRTISRQYYSSTALYYHYSRMAVGNYQQYLKGKPEVILKKYLYVLRPVVTLLFLEQKHRLPPTNFIETLENVQLREEIREHIHGLIMRKQQGDELGKGAADLLLNTFIEEHLERWHGQPFENDKKEGVTQELERVLQRIFMELEG